MPKLWPTRRRQKAFFMGNRKSLSPFFQILHMFFCTTASSFSFRFRKRGSRKQNLFAKTRISATPSGETRRPLTLALSPAVTIITPPSGDRSLTRANDSQWIGRVRPEETAIRRTLQAVPVSIRPQRPWMNAHFQHNTCHRRNPFGSEGKI